VETLARRIPFNAMAPNTTPISVENISIPDGLPKFFDSFAQLPNNPAPLYLSVTSERLIVYVPAVSTVNFISLEQLSVALRQTDRLVTALKALLETSTVTKVFFDARTPAKILFERCGIRLVKEVRSHKADALEVY
jgi:hypothetical protein